MKRSDIQDENGKARASGYFVTGPPGTDLEGFRADLLTRAYTETSDIATDDAGLVERLGELVHTIVGESLAFKITTPFDLLLAQAILADAALAEAPHADATAAQDVDAAKVSP